MEKLLVADPVDVRAGSGSDVDEGAAVGTGGSEGGAPQGYQHGSGAGGLSTEDLQKVVAAVAAALSGAGHERGTTFNTGRLGEDENRVLLEEKFFRNMDKFERSVCMLERMGIQLEHPIRWSRQKSSTISGRRVLAIGRVERCRILFLL